MISYNSGVVLTRRPPPTPSDNNPVLDEDGRPVIPEPVEPLPLPPPTGAFYDFDLESTVYDRQSFHHLRELYD